MLGLKPKRGSSFVEIPITFDYRGGGNRVSSSAKPMWTFFSFVVWGFLSLVSIIIGSGFWRFGFPVLSFILLIYVLRYLILRERYFRAKRREIIEQEYMFDHSVFWNSYEIGEAYPYIVSYGNGLKAIFVALDKDVIVGKDDTYSYDHQEAIADALQQMAKRGLEAMHIDFMDTVGKDSRLSSLFNAASRVENDDLRKVLTRKYDFIEATMGNSYASYDVYCFYSTYSDDVFWANLKVVLAHLKQANYIRYRILGRSDISVLVESLMNIMDFSVSGACDDLYRDLHRSEYIRPIWVEKSGERTQLNKTSDEMTQIKKVRTAEKKAKRKRKFTLSRKKQVEEEIDLFEEE